jgi:putative spermidine/putrescine transport system ATP-binding protein
MRRPFEGQSLSIRLTAGLHTHQDVLMVRPEKALALSVEQAAREPLAAGWNEVSARSWKCCSWAKARPAA